MDTPQLPQSIRDTITRVLPTMLGWCSVEKGIRLAELILASTEPEPLSVELGVHGGRSLLPLALGHMALGRGRVIGVDAWDNRADAEGTSDPDNREWWAKIDHRAVMLRCNHDLKQHCPTSYWQLLQMHSVEAAVHCPDGIVSLLHADSNHSPEVSQAELTAWIPKLRPGAWWIADDAEWPSLQETQRILREVHGATLVEDWGNWRVYQLPQERP